jgi:hypothetical protein
MAKSKAKTTEPARGPGLNNVRLDLDNAWHERLRLLAARRRLPLSRMARELVIEGIERAEKKS